MTHESLNDHDDDDEPRHNHKGGHEEGHDEPWLVSYADLMTLLFGFFVLMYTFTQAKLNDEQNMVKMRKEVAQYFGGEFVTPNNEKIEQFTKSLKEQKLDGFVDIKLSPEGAEVNLSSSILFDLGKADLQLRAQQILSKLAKIVISEKIGKKITVEGHTDSIPLTIGHKYKSNWDLSGARAAAVVDLFISQGVQPARLKAVAYADTKPLVPILDKDNKPLPPNQAKNRRVTIRIEN